MKNNQKNKKSQSTYQAITQRRSHKKGRTLTVEGETSYDNRRNDDDN